MNRRRFLAAVSLAAASGGCRWRRGNEVTLGAVVPRTGDRAPWGVDLLRGYELAVEQQNLRGGLNGRRLRLVALDDESREEHVTTLTTRLIEREGATAVLGELSSVANERAAAAAQRRGVVFVATASTARDVSRAGDFVFRTVLTDGEQAQAMARYARQSMQRRKGAIVYRRSSLLHVGMADAFASGFRGNGGEMVLRESYQDDADLVRLLGRVRSSGADVVYAPATSEDAGRIAVALRQARVTAQIMGADGWASPEARRFARDAMVGVLFADLFSPTSPRPEVEAFVAAFEARHRAHPGAFAAVGYDAARWVIAAALRVPQLDPHTLRDALLGSRLDDAVAGPFSVDARRALTRAICVQRHEAQGVALAAMMTP
ncbi:MAG: ABC transporter substrate-binding protein [Deltaproteobacteria bacterium]|nr:ABC transporter substrate-binding protein [Myxococcales bacterium]MDP3216293.1 ABC transporter substrate-binding protein [Deltaproteobacteria bacterium]